MDATGLGVLGFRPGVAFHLAGPLQKPAQFLPLAPHKPEKFQESDTLHLDPRVGFDPPTQIGAAPGRQTVAAIRVPDKTQDVTHSVYLVYRGEQDRQ